MKSKTYRNPFKGLNTIISSLERTECNYEAKQANLDYMTGQRKFIPNNANHKSVSQEQHI